MTKAGRTRRQRCVTCRPSEWREIGAKARAGDMDVSAYILSRVLDGEAPDGPPHPEAGYPMALTGGEQRRQFEIVERFVAGCGPMMQAPLADGLGMTIGQAVSFVTLSLDADETVQEGRARDGVGISPASELVPEPRPGPGSELESRTADASDAGPPTDLFDLLDAGAPSGADATPGDFLDDIVEDLNREGES